MRIALQVEPISRRAAAKVAMQGTYKSTNIKKEYALKGVKICIKAWLNWASFAAPIKTVKVLTTASLAVKPVISAVAARQSPKPKGANKGAIKAPKEARILWSVDTTFNRQSKVCKNQINTVAKKMTVNAFLTNSLAFSHI